MGLALVEGIAALGAVDYRAVGLEGFGRPDNYLERQVSRWQRQLESYSDCAGWPGAESLPGGRVSPNGWTRIGRRNSRRVFFMATTI